MMEPARRRAPAPIRVGPHTPPRPGGYPSSTPGSIDALRPISTSTVHSTVSNSPVCRLTPLWPSALSCAADQSDLNGCTMRVHRGVDGGQRADYSQTELSARDGHPSGGDGVDE